MTQFPRVVVEGDSRLSAPALATRLVSAESRSGFGTSYLLLFGGFLTRCRWSRYSAGLERLPWNKSIISFEIVVYCRSSQINRRWAEKRLFSLPRRIVVPDYVLLLPGPGLEQGRGNGLLATTLFPRAATAVCGDRGRAAPRVRVWLPCARFRVKPRPSAVQTRLFWGCPRCPSSSEHSLSLLRLVNLSVPGISFRAVS